MHSMSSLIRHHQKTMSTFYAARLPRIPMLVAVSLAFASPTLAQPVPAPKAADTSGEVPVNLDVFTVNSVKDRGYGASSLSSATRLAAEAQNVPQSISVLNSEFLKDLSVWRLDQALRYTPNVTQRQNIADGATIRGFLIFNRYRNGFLTPSYESDSANVERVEIIRGAAASVAGASETGGLLNLITKKPLWTPRATTTVTVGSDSFLRGVVDLTGPVPGSASLAYRMVAAYTHADGWRDGEKIRKTAFSPSLAWKLGKRTQLLAEIEYLSATLPQNDGAVYVASVSDVSTNPIQPPAGVTSRVPSLNRWTSSKFNSGEPDFSRDVEVQNAFLTLTHAFNDVFSFRQGAQIAHSDQESVGGSALHNFFYNATGDLLMNRTYRRSIARANNLRLQGDLVAAYSFAGTKNSSLLGYEFSRSLGKSVNAPGTLAPLSIFNPVYGGARGPLAVATDQSTRNQGLGYFANHQLSAFAERLIVTAGLRRDTAKGARTTNNLNGVQVNGVAPDDTDSPMYGVTVKPLKWLALYGVHSEAGAPNAVYSRYVNIPIDSPLQQRLPRTPITTNTEAGAKVTLFNGGLLLTVARFKIEQQDNLRPNLDPSVPGGQENVLESNVAKGWEIEWSGSVQALAIYGGYARMDTEASGFKPGSTLRRELRGVPDHKLSTFVRYDLAKDAQGNGFSVNAGMVYQTSVYGRAENNYRIPGATRFDAGLGYTRNRWDYRLTVENISDVFFVQATAGQGSNTIEPPRTFYLSGTRRW